jgi:hypothetical protein
VDDDNTDLGLHDRTQLTLINGGRKGRTAHKALPASDPPSHVLIGRVVLAAAVHDGTPYLLSAEKGGTAVLYQYREGLWHPVSDLSFPIREAADGVGIHTNKRLLNETTTWIRSDVDLVRYDAEWDQHGLIPCGNGLVNPKTGKLEAYNPKHLATWRSPHAYNPQAECPKWRQLVRDFFRDKPEDERPHYENLLQEAFGVGFWMGRPRSLSRALVLWGPERRQVADPPRRSAPL